MFTQVGHELIYKLLSSFSVDDFFSKKSWERVKNTFEMETILLSRGVYLGEIFFGY